MLSAEEGAAPATSAPQDSGLPRVAAPVAEAAPAAAEGYAAAPEAAPSTAGYAAEPVPVAAATEEAAPAAEPASEAISDNASVTSEASEASRVSRVLGKIQEKVGPTVARVSEMESVQKGVAYVSEKAQTIAESERVQASVDWAKKKATEIAESERGQKVIEVAKDTSKVVMEKTQQGIEVVKERTQQTREKLGSVWSKGRGTISRVRNEGVRAVAWRGSARDTLDIAAREEQWKNIKVQGAEELTVPARTEHTCAYHVSKGSTLRWTFRVKDKDIGFSVRMRVQVWGGSQEEEVLEMERYDNADTISGSWVADEDRTMILAFDNRYSKLRSKTVAYIVGTEKPPVFTEPVPKEEPAAAEAPKPVI
eukprot:CAMPEP_0197629676 /NCGR_PEP_ID=MMETSP1338-20131121/7430_1 /TAXON_ID=43686 ORGANISM="Pelagodinium beii, Strain RCC1491" /NCGR_SAMPLE_ID=MMETSP1338 /ASSEMBLY_ACC=CAM_ASM_000754 /LENGTH=365 /DNA_ID=CAMNT_0043200755 /DNA_START=295 /DNA_END=1392 /DNA_ORIENTATION=+